MRFQMLLVAFLPLIFVLQINCFLNLNEEHFKNVEIYKCPVIADSMHPERLDQSIIVFRNNTIQSLIQSNSIIVRTDSNIMHRVSFFGNMNDFSFYHASSADLEDILHETNTSHVKSRSSVISNDNNLYTEDVINDYEYNQLKSLARSSFENGVYEIEDENNEIYKCIGNSIPFSKHFSVFVVLKLTSTTNGYKVGDTIFSSKSFGYLERITNISRIDTSDGDKIVIETNLSQCGNSLFGEIIKRNELDTISSELDCSSGESSKLYIMNSQNSLKTDSIGKLIAGRETSSFAIQILSKQIVGDYLVFEGISVTHLNNSIATKLSINNQYNFPFKKTYEYSATSGGTKIVAFK